MIKPRAGFQSMIRLNELADFTIPFAVRAICHIGIADHLANGPQRIEGLATATGTHEASLLRALRALGTAGVFAEPEPEVFELTPISDLLRSDHPLSMRWAFRLRPDVDAWAELEQSIRTGDVAFERVFGMTYWDYLAAHPDLQAEFRDSQRALSRLELQALLRVYDWRNLKTVVDLGGNDGTFISGLLVRYPDMRGTVIDLPAAQAEAAKVLAEAAVEERCAVIGGDLFTAAIPPKADAYTIKRVLIGFSDDEAVALFRILRDIMRPDSRLVILEPRSADDALSAAMDLHMLVLGEGSVRTPEHFAKLLASAGMTICSVIDARLLTLIDARLT